eukprot:CAMPEP_0197533508 /NCGR_PEP_ID=MMETSP1318-20131121/43726_1 /TAXON_ID=552666 /ORGANISM="Partenskyella glossopodia, Strain RCC365" /LENGTH=158 /DNA_ID=CAMNT_0043090433 /DNA_START=1 /DNA_END=477 /DNA_ORIENTATION=+
MPVWYLVGPFVAKFIKSKVALRIAQSAGRIAFKFGVKWAPYYIIKFAVVRRLKDIGASRSYRILVRKSKELVKDEAQRAIILASIRKGYRVPAAMWAVIQEIDAFLTDLIFERSSDDAEEASDAALLEDIRSSAKLVLISHGKKIDESKMLPPPSSSS